MDRGSDIPFLEGFTMGRGPQKPGVGVQNTMDTGLIYHG